MSEETFDNEQRPVTGAETTTNLMGLEQAGQAIGVSRYTISGWIQRGLLPAVQKGRRRFVHPADLAEAQEIAHLGLVVPLWRQDCQRCGQRLRALREATGLSQQQLAAKTGLTHEAISRLETGHNAPYADTVRTLARALQAQPAQFVGFEPIGLTDLSVRETARQLGIPTKRTQRWIREGVLPARKVSGQWRVPAVAVRELGGSGRLRGQSLRLDPRYRG